MLSKVLAVGSFALIKAELPAYYFRGWYDFSFTGERLDIWWDGKEWKNNGKTGWGGNFSSFELGPNTRLKLCYTDCKDSHMYGDSTEVYGPLEVGDMGELSDWTCGIQLSGMGTKGKPNTGNVLIFESEGCEAGYAGIFGEGRHDDDSLSKNHIGNDKAHGILVDERTTVEVFDWYNFDSKSPTVLFKALQDTAIQFLTSAEAR